MHCFQKSLNGRDLHFFLVYFFFAPRLMPLLLLFLLCFYFIFSSQLVSLFCIVPNMVVCMQWGSLTKRNCLLFAGLEHWRANMRFFMFVCLCMCVCADTFGMLPMEKHCVYFRNDWKIMLIISTNKTVSVAFFVVLPSALLMLPQLKHSTQQNKTWK